jgi:predicted PurR-regulated permease PerM
VPLDLAFGLGLGSRIAPLVLLTAACAMIPILGAPAVWIPLDSWLFYHHQYVAGIILALHSLLIVSNVDNLARMLVLKGAAGMHPLLGLISVLGGIEFMGFIGVFIGPIVAAVFLSLLRIFKQQLEELESPPPIPARHAESTPSIGRLESRSDR